MKPAESSPSFFSGWKASPARIAIVLNLLVAAIALTAVGLHLQNFRHQITQELRAKAAGMVQSQATLTGSQIRTLELLMLQLETRLNIERSLYQTGAARSANSASDTTHDLARSFLDLVPYGVNLLLLHRSQEISAATNVLDRHVPFDKFCARLRAFKTNARSSAIEVFNEVGAGDCPPQGTLIYRKPLKTSELTDIEEIWLLIDPEILDGALQTDVSELHTSYRYRVLNSASRELLSHSSPGTEEAMSATVRSEIKGTGIQIEMMYAPQEAVDPLWKPYVRFWAMVAMVFLLSWWAISYLVVNMIRRHADEVQGNEKRFNYSLDYAHVGIWEWNVKTDALYWSQQVGPIFGYPPGESHKSYTNFLAAVHPDDRQAVQNAVDSSINESTKYSIKHRVVWPDGSVRWVQEQGDVLRDTDGSPLLMFGVVQDITERVTVEEAFQNSEARRKVATDSGRVAIWEVNLDTNQLIWDENCFALYQLRKEDFNGTFEEWTRRIHPQDLTLTIQAFENAVAGIADYDLTFRVVWPNGETRHMEAHGKVIRDGNGTAKRLIGTNWDITEQKRNEEALRASVSEKTALLQEVHHRVKNNLQVISSLLRLEASRSKVDSTKAVLGEMKNRIHAMAQLHELLYRSGTFATVDLGTYLGQLATQAFRIQVVHPESVVLKLNMEPVRVNMDQATAAGLVLNELISNCLKHSFPGERSGEIGVELKPVRVNDQLADDRWCLRVSDNGVGLPGDFEEKRKESLGLQLVNDLSQQLGGVLTIDSSPGQGAQFSVVFVVPVSPALEMPT
jgi:PAS domain S-box-containing protein